MYIQLLKGIQVVYSMGIQINYRVFSSWTYSPAYIYVFWEPWTYCLTILYQHISIICRVSCSRAAALCFRKQKPQPLLESKLQSFCCPLIIIKCIRCQRRTTHTFLSATYPNPILPHSQGPCIRHFPALHRAASWGTHRTSVASGKCFRAANILQWCKKFLHLPLHNSFYI